MLGLMGATAATVLVAYGPAPHGPRWWRRIWSRKPTVTAMPPCIVRPEQTEGPYCVDERLDRSDIQRGTRLRGSV